MAASGNTDPNAAWRQLRQRLTDSLPYREAQQPHFGAQFSCCADPRLIDMPPGAPRAAAVLVGITAPTADEEPGILLTVRAAHLRQHAGQICFPGGSIDASDAGPVAAAMREAREEVGLTPGSAQLLGFLPDQYVLTGFRVTPVVAQLPADFTPRIADQEVQASFILPFSVLLDPATERAGMRTVAGIDVAVRDLQYGEHCIWGATAGMLLTLRAMALS